MEAIADKKLENKLRGGYYTPKAITEFICRWAITAPTQKVLEPSCGDGNFIEAAIQRYLELGIEMPQLEGLVQGVELVEEEARKAKRGLWFDGNPQKPQDFRREEKLQRTEKHGFNNEN